MRRNKSIVMLGCRYLSRSRYLFIRIFHMPKSVRSEMISYFESFPRNWSNKEVKITIICALITSLCMRAFCRIHPPLFLSEYLDKKRTGSRSSLITTFKVSVSSRKKRTLCLTAPGVGDRVAGGWKTGECTEVGSLEAIDTHISHLVPNNVHGVCPLLNFIAAKSSCEL